MIGKKYLVVIGVAVIVLATSLYYCFNNIVGYSRNGMLADAVYSSYGYGYSVSPVCGNGYTDNTCHTGALVSKELCRIGTPSVTKFESFRGQKNARKWSCTYGGKTEYCSVRDDSQCVIVVAEGINPNGKFFTKIQNKADKYLCSNDYRKIVIKFTGSKKGDVVETINQVNQVLKDYNQNEDQNEKILVVGHSLGALATFFVKTRSGNSVDASYLMFDPPYNYPNTKYADFPPISIYTKLMESFDNDNASIIWPRNGSYINDARKRGLNGSYPGVVDWTNGLDMEQNTNDTRNDDQLHELFMIDSNALNAVDTWIKSNCKVK